MLQQVIKEPDQFTKDLIAKRQKQRSQLQPDAFTQELIAKRAKAQPDQFTRNLISERAKENNETGFWRRAGQRAIFSGLSLVKGVREVFEPPEKLGEAIKEALPSSAIEAQEEQKKAFERLRSKAKPEEAKGWKDIAADIVGEVPSFFVAGGLSKKLTQNIANNLLRRGSRGALTSFVFDISQDHKISPEQAVAFAGIDALLIPGAKKTFDILKQVKQLKNLKVTAQIPKSADDLFGAAEGLVPTELDRLGLAAKTAERELAESKRLLKKPVVTKPSKVATKGREELEEFAGIGPPKEKRAFVIESENVFNEKTSSFDNIRTVKIPDHVTNPIDNYKMISHSPGRNQTYLSEMHADIVEGLERVGNRLTDKELNAIVKGAYSDKTGQVLMQQLEKVPNEVKNDLFKNLREMGYSNQQLDEFAKTIKFADKAIPEVVKDATEVVSPELKTLQGQFFATLKRKGISTESQEYKALLEEGLGINDLKFKGKTAVGETQMRDMIRRVNSLSVDDVPQDRLTKLINGEMPVILGEDLGNQSSSSFRVARVIFNKGLTSVETMMRRTGPIGNQIAERILKFKAWKDRTTQQDLSVIKQAFKKFNNKETREFIKSYETDTVDFSKPKFKDAYDLLRPVLHEKGLKAEELGFKIRSTSGKGVRPFTLKENYWPHVFDFDITKATKGRERLIKHWMKKNGVTRGEAMAELDKLAKLRNSNLDPNLEFERAFNAGGWLGDPTFEGFTKRKAIRGLSRYVDGANRRLGEATFFDAEGKRVFGEGWKSFNELVNMVGDRDKQNLLVKGLEAVRGLNSSEVENTFLGALRNYQIVQKLFFATIPNAFQNAITTIPKVQGLGFTRGVKAVIKGGFDAFANPNFARLEVGAAVNQTLKDITGMSSRGFSGRLANIFLKINGFSAVEARNNIVAASMGRVYINEAFKVVTKKQATGTFIGKRLTDRLIFNAKKELKLFGISEDAIKRGSLASDEIAEASWRMARLTQFRGGAFDIPLYANGPLGKLAFQFKTFAFNINKLAWHNFGKPAMKFMSTGGKEGTLLPLTTFLGASLLSGEVIAYIRSELIWGRKRPEEAWKRILDDLFWAGSFGLWYDIYQSHFWGGAAKSALGPTFGDIFDAEKALRSEKAGKEFLRKQIPIIGQTPIGKETKRRTF
ncbi:hypothetical protein LCGC14_0351390 [marine sediment metagenome]|uniref:Large polyvalent protein associated domain-containing protein n=1 Tax=marine sediment metagenome TaxID=412755 RepID=A0A0F9TAR3_9ZZZZ